jgi:hypothetical protein
MKKMSIKKSNIMVDVKVKINQPFTNKMDSEKQTKRSHRKINNSKKYPNLLTVILVISIGFCLFSQGFINHNNILYPLSWVVLALALVMKIIVPLIHDLQEKTNSLHEKMREQQNLHIQKLPD